MGEPADELDRELGDEPRLTLMALLTRSCEPCRELRPKLERLGRERADICRVVLVDVDDRPEVAERYGVTAFPTVICLTRGREVFRFKGGALPPSMLSRLAG
ncbi:MAG TPA: thioredoxin family protein [Candidatus Dormibacteraeota bacterium]|jgi:thioredoxin 1|nr:thioredoxin family protein [Candidatus Dormibacteraeota bacterium]